MARILIIDDDADTREVIEVTLRAAGHEVFSARDGNEGLKSHAAQPAELIISDIFMPNKEGLETIRALRRNNDKVKIIAMTGMPDLGNPLGTALRLGANRTLEKPFRPDQLLAVVQEVLISKV